jgi:hypothetical protein
MTTETTSSISSILSYVRGARMIRSTKIPALDLSGAFPSVPIGFAAIFVARRSTKAQDEINSMLAASDGPQRLLTMALKEAGKRATLALPLATDLLLQQDTFLDVRYGEGVIAPALFLTPEVNWAVVVLPFKGERISTTAFSVDEYSRPAVTGDLEVIIATFEPLATSAESAASRAVPADHSFSPLAIVPDEHAYDVLAMFAVTLLICVTILSPAQSLDTSLPGANCRPGAPLHELLRARQKALSSSV